MPKQAAPPRLVQCYHCRRRFQAGAQSMTIPCPGCHKVVQVDDQVVKTLKAVRKLQTCGKVVIEKKGRVVAELVEAHQGVEVEGVLEANVLSGGPVRIRAKARWKGDCRAPALEVEAGGTIQSGYFVIPDHSLGLEDLRPRPEKPAPPKKKVTLRKR